MDKSRSKKIIVEDNALLNETKTTKGRGKKKSTVDVFADIAVPTASLQSVEQTKTTTKKQLIKDDAPKETFTKKGYTRPETTYTDQLSKEQIEEKLEDYAKVEDMFKVPLGVHIRYFSNSNGKMLFRMGGQLYNNRGLPDYVILNSGSAQWSVQVKDTIFYRKMTMGEIKTEYQNIIDELIQKNKKLLDKLNDKSTKK